MLAALGGVRGGARNSPRAGKVTRNGLASFIIFAGDFHRN
jgi:hypothetical protein